MKNAVEQNVKMPVHLRNLEMILNHIKLIEYLYLLKI